MFSTQHLATLFGQLQLPALVVLSLLLSGCFPEDEPLILPSAQQDQTGAAPLKRLEAPMGETYTTAVYVDLETHSLYPRAFDAYDLAFALENGEPRLYLSRGKMSRGAPTQAASLAEPLNLADYTLAPDVPSLHPDSLVFAPQELNKARQNWSPVYLIDRGRVAHSDSAQRFRRLQFRLDGERLHLRWSRLQAGEAYRELTLPGPTSNTWRYALLEDGQGEVFPEPQESWQLLFTQYMHDFGPQADPAFRYYSVTGALTNRAAGVQSLELDPETLPFDSLTHTNQLDQAAWSNEPDVIGYDWKNFDLNQGYRIETDRYYALRTPSGQIWKLRFTAFLNDQGVKGHPAFQYQLLQPQGR